MTPGNLVNHHLHDYIGEKVAQGVDGVGTLCEKKNGESKYMVPSVKSNSPSQVSRHTHGPLDSLSSAMPLFAS